MTAAAPGGVRYDASLTREQRSSIFNGIWLCQTCSDLVDNDPGTYPVDVLRDWKERAESNAHAELEGARSRLQEPRPPADVISSWECPFCKTNVADGVRVCLGCHADVVYGLTPREASDMFKIGMLAGCGLGCVVFIELPRRVCAWLGSSVDPFHEFFPLPLIAVALLGFTGAFFVSKSAYAWRRKRPPRFIRASVNA